VLGPPSRKNTAGISVAVRYDNGHAGDVRASALEALGQVDAESELDAPVQLSGSVAPSPQALPFRPPPRAKLEAVIALTSRRTRTRTCEDVQAPELYSSDKFPSQNFIEAVIHKDPEREEPDAPSTQSIVAAKASYHSALPDDPIQRQKELIKIYTSESHLYPQMNLALRQDDIKRLKYFGAYIRELCEAFLTDHVDQVITPFVGTTWRGITVPDVDHFLKDYAPHTEFVWQAFTSTTTDKQIAQSFGNVTFEIQCRQPPDGSFDDEFPEFAPADISMFSDSREETEILVPPNTRFRVITVQKPPKTSGSHDSPFGGPATPIIFCETMGYDSIWDIMGSGNHHEVHNWCKANPVLVDGDHYTHSILHAAIDSGDDIMVEAVLQSGANANQLCPRTGLKAHEKFALTGVEEDFPEASSPVSLDMRPQAPAAESFPSSMASSVAHKTEIGAEPLAGGFFKGDLVTYNGAPGKVVGRPARAALRNISVAVRLDSGALDDVRVAKLTLRG